MQFLPGSIAVMNYLGLDAPHFFNALIINEIPDVRASRLGLTMPNADSYVPSKKLRATAREIHNHVEGMVRDEKAPNAVVRKLKKAHNRFVSQFQTEWVLVPSNPPVETREPAFDPSEELPDLEYPGWDEPF
jgi:hypothetical protein